MSNKFRKCQSLRERERELKSLSKNVRLKRKSILLAVFFVAGFLGFTTTAFASSTNGTIDSTNRYAWIENAGWLDFGGSYGSVLVTDLALSGYAFSETVGWISLNCSNTSSCGNVDYKVSNDGNGTLTGYAWGENAGWVKFDPQGGGVSINSEGIFSGYAYGENIGWIVFNCTTTNSCAAVDYKVGTDYRPKSARAACNNSSDDDGDGKTDYPSDPGCFSADDTNETDPGGGGPLGSVSASIIPSRLQTVYPDGRVAYWDEQQASVISVVPGAVKAVVENISNVLEHIVPNFFGSGRDASAPSEPPSETLVAKSTPPIFDGNWNLLFTPSVGHFVLAPLPQEIVVLAKKFPELGRTFTKLGITKISDLDRLKNAKFVLRGISQKQSFPSEIVFAKTSELIDYNIHLAITDTGSPEQIINTLAGKTLDLVVKADKPAKNVKGYLVVKKIDRQTARVNVPATSFMAGAIMATLGMSLPANKDVQIENKMVLSEFEYEDKNNDGIYMAGVQMPLVHGEYEVISIIEYKDAFYGKKELRLTAVVDPEGYIYEKNGDKETRIPNAKVSLMWKNPKTSTFELWPAKDFQQVNPQKTDKSGTYSFLVPEGTYTLTISAPGYYDLVEEGFDVNEGSGVHENISLHPKSRWTRFLRFFYK